MRREACVPKDADRYWSTADVECEKAMIKIDGVPTIISRRSVFLDKHSLDPTGGLDSYRLTKEMGRRNRNQRQRQDVKNGTIAEKLQRKALNVKTVSRESRQGQMFILYPLIENLYKACVEHTQSSLVVGDFPP
jgi:hypothetical protein